MTLWSAWGRSIGLVVVLGAASAGGIARLAMRGMPVSVRATVYTTKIGHDPVALALDERSGRLAIAVGGGCDPSNASAPVTGGQVLVADGRTGVVRGQVAVGPSPCALVVDPDTGYVVVADYGGSRVDVLDVRRAVVRAIARVGVGPRILAADARGRRVLVGFAGLTDSVGHPLGHGGVALLGTRSGRVVWTTPVPGSPVALAMDERTGHAIVLSSEGAALLLDMESGRTVRTTPTGPFARAIVVDERSGRAFILNSGDVGENSVTVLDTGSGAVVRSVATGMGMGMGAGASLAALAVDERAGRVYVVGGFQHPSLGVLDARTGTFLQRLPLPVIPAALAVDERAGRVYVVDGPGSRSAVLDARTGGAIATVPLGASPQSLPSRQVKALVVDARGGRAYVLGATQVGFGPTPRTEGWLSVITLSP